MVLYMSAGICADAQEAPISVKSPDVTINFGLPDRLQDNSEGGKYLQTGALLAAEDDLVKAAGDGRLLFIQDNRRLSGGFPHAIGNFTAIAHSDGFVSLYSANAFMPDSKAMTAIRKNDTIGSIARAANALYSYYILHVYDGASRLWVNPAFFIRDLVDDAAPTIEEVSLLRQGHAIIAENLRKGTQNIAQGDYTLAVRVTDPAYARGSISGIFRLKAVFDGKVVSDRKFDSARITEKGLVFLDLEAPSSTLTDENGRILLGRQFVPRGMHTLEFSVYDYAGNSRSFIWKFTAE